MDILGCKKARTIVKREAFAVLDFFPDIRYVRVFDVDTLLLETVLTPSPVNGANHLIGHG